MTYTAHEYYGGIFGWSIPVTVDSRLKYMPYAQAGWRICCEEHKKMEMYSYSSKIFTARFCEAGLYEIHTLYADAAMNYSRTTSRQVTAAMQELGLCGGEIAALKRFFIRGGKCACAGADSWWDAETGAVIWEGVRG